MANLETEQAADQPPQFITLRNHCECGWMVAKITVKSGHNCAYCTECDKYQYNVPKVDTGQKKRSVTTLRRSPKPKQRFRILSLDRNRCAICRATDKPLQIGHIVSVKDALANCWTSKQINADSNLFTVCEECNLGEGSQGLPKDIAARILADREGN